MSIDSIKGLVQPGPAPGEVSPVSPKQATFGAATKDAVPVELPMKAIRELSPAQEEKQLEDATKKINEFVKGLSSTLQFSVDKETGKTVVKVIEKETGEVIRQIPSEEMLQIAKAIDTLQGLIIRKQA
ncbi:flagellar protein FlaG [Geobacter sp. DSM 9736]|uniref:flagellar protein FlaG n=1 Tax=Geobacter sp. DSM 9736 TaxID=1277350 RepID=UPI000B50D3A0|nr:flagellar protein FlaG [Geobacter sp. DSM 9736]SNB46996.1 flagellar protein FlaG [Geobacter sp. DSM 9736]